MTKSKMVIGLVKRSAAMSLLCANRHELSDHTPYLEMTTGYGKTWHRIDRNIPDGDYAWVIREDPVRRGLLYAGTEGGIFISFDDGANWQSLRRNMPLVAVRDMKVKNDDLVAATHGRAFWILDGLHVLREISPEVTDSSVHLFTVPLTYRLMGAGFDFSRSGSHENHGPGFVRILGDGAALHQTRQADGSLQATYTGPRHQARQKPPAPAWSIGRPRRPTVRPQTYRSTNDRFRTACAVATEAGPLGVVSVYAT
ncbi:MAG TPA: hypothetical protein VFA39_19170 [Steroidobacteraceae bacterium]|nr:hypothetical protein [Steroidobacteraceae bacterium]